MSYNSKYTGEQVEGFLDQIANGEISGGSSVYKWNWNSEMNGTFTEEEFENLSNADVVYITTGVADMEMLYSVDGRAVVEDALHLGAHILSFETDTDNSKAAYVESITFIFDNASKTWNAQGGDAELITNEQLTSALEDKQDKITDLDAIRSGAEKGATALQSVPSEYVTETELTNKGYATTSALNDKVDKVSGKQLSTEDFTTALKTKLEGLSNYDDTELSEALSTLRGDFDKLVSGDTSTAIESFNEIMAFLDGIKDTQDLAGIIAAIEQQIAGKMDKVTLATVATSGSYNDLSNKPTIPAEQVNADWNATSGKAQILNKPTIPSAVTESTVSGWGFTKNTGTYSKPSGGIPKSDLASAVQTSLGKADTALQSYTEQYKGTVTGVKINGTTKNPSSGVVDLGTVITSHQDISGKADKSSLAAVATSGSYNDLTDQPDFIKGVAINGTTIANTSGTVYIPNASTGGYGVTRLNSSISSTSTTESATPSAVKAAYDLANSKQDKLESGTNIKTINGQSIVGSGNLIIEGGSGGVSQENFDNLASFVDDLNEDISQLTANAVSVQIQGDLRFADYTDGMISRGRVIYALPDSVSENSTEDDIIATANTLKTINGQSLIGEGDITISGGGGGGEDIRFFTDFTVEQVKGGATSGVTISDDVTAFIDAARNNKLICVPYADVEKGYAIASYKFTDGDEYGIRLHATIFDNGANYGFWVVYNGFDHTVRGEGVSVFRPRVEYIDGTEAYIELFNNTTYVCVNDVSYLSAYPFEDLFVGATVRFTPNSAFSLESMDFMWANGQMPEIEPYIPYELSITMDHNYNFLAVLTPFKIVQ